MTDSPFIDEQLIQDSMEPMATLGWVYQESSRSQRDANSTSMRWWANYKTNVDIDVNHGALRCFDIQQLFYICDSTNMWKRIGFNTPLAAAAFLQLQGEQL